MPFEDIAQFVANSFDLPYGGKTYTIPAPSAQDGLWLQAILDGAESFVLTRAVGAANRKVIVGDEEERTAYQLAMGPAYQQMVDDGVTWPVLKHAGMTAWIYWCRSSSAAERYWAQLPDGSGNAPAPETPQTPGDTSPGGPSTPSPVSPATTTP